MPNCDQKCIEDEAKNFYIQKMDDYYKNCNNKMVFDGNYYFSYLLLRPILCPKSL